MTPQPRPLPGDFAGYKWTATAEDVARRRGLDPAVVIRFDANVPPLPGVPQIPVGESFARLNEYPPGGYRELHAAAAGYVGVDSEQIVLGAGSDSLIHLDSAITSGPDTLRPRYEFLLKGMSEFHF